MEVEINDDDRAFAAGAADALRRSISTEATPDPTTVSNRCTACEFRNYCGDVW